jgi:uncharacterized damage-inducible protein DinB
MTLAQQAAAELAALSDFFRRSTRGLTEEHSAVTPAPGMMTAAQQVAHAAQTIDWFMEGAFRPEGFSMDFEEHGKVVAGVTSLAAAREWFDASVAKATELASAKTDAEWLEPLPAGPIMGGLPRFAIIGAMTDHTAHHRGALTVYARLQGVVPPMPYMDM